MTVQILNKIDEAVALDGYFGETRSGSGRAVVWRHLEVLVAGRPSAINSHASSSTAV